MNKRPFTPKGKANFSSKDGGKPPRKPFDKEERPFRKPFGEKPDRPYKKSFDSSDRPARKPFDKEERPFRKSFGDKSDRPFKKSFGSSDRPGRKPFDKEERPFKKSFGDKSDRPFKKSFGSSDRPDRKPFDKEDRPFRKPFGDKSDRPFKKSFGSSDRPGHKPFDKEERPFKKSFGDKSDRPFKKSFGSSDRPDRKPFDKEERPFKKSFGDKSDRPFKKSFGSSDRPARKPFDKEDRPFRKSFGDKPNRPYKKSFDSSDRPARKPFDKGGRAFGKSGGEAEKPFPKKRKSLGKFEEEDLSFGKRPAAPLKPEKPAEDEVTFSKSLDKWETAPITPSYGSVEQKFRDKKPRAEDHQDKFKRRFDQENPKEKAYSATPGKTGNYPGKETAQGVDYYSEKATEGEMPLNKFLAHCGICSRRDAVEIIKAGKVKVNGDLIVEPGHKVTLEDQVTLSGKKLSVQKNLLYILLNKPKGYITTTDDPQGRPTVLDFFVNQIEERIFPVGRLDRNTTGLLLLTNDGDLTQVLAHPKYEIRKVYQVTLDKNLSAEDFSKVQTGVVLEDGPAPVDQIAYLDDKKQLGLEIHNGRNRIVRRIFESLGYEVEKLDRVMYAGLTKKNLVRGKWRFLSKQEVINLKHFKQ